MCNQTGAVSSRLFCKTFQIILVWDINLCCVQTMGHLCGFVTSRSHRGSSPDGWKGSKSMSSTSYIAKEGNIPMLSRLPCPQCKRETHETQTIQFIPGCTPEEISKKQLDDSVVGPVLQAKLKGEKPVKEEQRKCSYQKNWLFTS